MFFQGSYICTCGRVNVRPKQELDPKVVGGLIFHSEPSFVKVRHYGHACDILFKLCKFSKLFVSHIHNDFQAHILVESQRQSSPSIR